MKEQFLSMCMFAPQKCWHFTFMYLRNSLYTQRICFTGKRVITSDYFHQIFASIWEFNIKSWIYITTLTLQHEPKVNTATLYNVNLMTRQKTRSTLQHQHGMNHIASRNGPLILEVWIPMLLSRFRFELDSDLEDVEVDSSGLHLKPKDGLKLRVFKC